ncbi:MAG: hypothetical protein AAFZ07_07895 [Actinomycetota bacterium]
MTSYSPALWRAPRMDGLIDRPRLRSASDAAVEIVTGPSGIGKTAYALQAAGDRESRLAWVRCVPGTAAAADLVALAHRSLGVDHAVSSDDPLVLAGELLARLEAEPTVLVIDELHAADPHTVDPMLAEMIALLDPISSVVVTSRPRPAGLIGRVSRFARVVGDDELRFDRDEAERLFVARGWATDDVDAWLEGSAGWAVALDLASGAAAPDGTDPSSMLSTLVRSRVGDAWPDLVAVAACPYLTPEIESVVGIDDADRLLELLPVSVAGGRRTLPGALREAVLDAADPGQVEAARRRALAALRTVDPLAAVQLAVELDELDAAAELLNDLVGTISVEAAMTWAYRLPPALRHRLPPALTGGRATVNPDLAELEASERLERATDDEERAAAAFSLASVRTAQAELDDAAGLLEQTLALTAEPLLRSRAQQLQSSVRWWQGDLGGARASIAGDPESAWSGFVEAMIALAEGADDLAGDAARRSVAADEAAGSPTTLGSTATALVEAVRGDRTAATSTAEEAWAGALDAGGFELGAAGVATVWLRAAGGDAEGASARAREVEARVGPRDPFARAGIAMARALLAGQDPDDHGRAERRRRAIRSTGFAAVEAVFDRLRSEEAGAETGLLVELLGEGAVVVDGVQLDASAWRSRKAVEVVRYLAHRGGRCRREEVIEAIWPDRPPAKGRALLRNALSEVRAGLEPQRRAGEDSRFVTADREMVRLEARTDLADASEAEDGPSLRLLATGVAADLDADWATDVSRTRERLLAERADRIRRDPTHPDRRLALEVLGELEPWNRSLIDELVELLRATGDEAGAAAVERRWFEDE